MKLTIGFSPCPNDTFIFDALVNSKTGDHKLRFNPVIEDVEVLNKMALESKLAITKLSIAVLPLVAENYRLLSAGAALGRSCGPLLVAKKPIADLQSTISRLTLAIPGIHTTAFFLLKYFFGSDLIFNEMLFSDIEDAVVNEKADAGLIIHENRFTYEKKGLLKLIDLGEEWETKTGLPIPLGGIAINKKLSAKTASRVNQLIRESVKIALQNPAGAMPFVHRHAQAMEEQVMMQHIGLYVNEHTIDLGELGKKAVHQLLSAIDNQHVSNQIDIVD